MINKIRYNKLFNQILKFGIVGGMAFVIDYSVLVLFKEIFKLDVLLSASIAFTVSVIFNYIASIKVVFDVNQNKSNSKSFILFIIFSIFGLGITEIIMYLGTEKLNMHYLIVKVIATILVMVFNFITRKKFLE